MFLLKSVSLPFLYLGNAMCWSIQHSRNPPEICLPHDKRPYPSEALHGRTHQHRNMREMPGFGTKVGSFLEILVIWWWCGCDVHPIPMDGRTPEIQEWKCWNTKSHVICQVSRKPWICHKAVQDSWVESTKARKLLPAKRAEKHWKKPRWFTNRFKKSSKLGYAKSCQ